MFSSIQSTGRLRHTYWVCFILFSIAALPACGGSSGGSSKSSNSAPTAAITSPLDGDVYTYGEAITFTGSGSDDEDGELTGASLVWSSDLDGSVGTGASFTLSDLSWGDHTLTLTATDSDGETGSDSIYLSVKAWSHPADLTDNISPDGQDAYSPQVAMDGNGNAVIVWYQLDSSGNYQIFKSEYRDGAWAHPSGLTDNISPDGQDATSPWAAMDDNGNAVITWLQYDGTSYQIFKSEYRDGGWTHPASLTDSISPNNKNASDPRVAMDNNGNAIITWYQYDGSHDQVLMSEYRNGAWTHPTGLTSHINPDGYNAKFPRVAMDDNGNAVITWQQSDEVTDFRLYKSEYRNGAWAHPSLTDNFSTSNAVDPELAMDASGNAVITWYLHDGTYPRIFMSEYRDGGWAHPDDLTDFISPEEHSARYPQVAMSDSGNAVITWQQYDDSGFYQILKSEYRDGAWTHPADISDNISPDGTSAVNPHVAMDENGNAVITWVQPDDSNNQIFKSEYRNGAWDHPVDRTVSISPDGRHAEGHQVAMDNNGNAVIVWTSYGGIFKSEYRNGAWTHPAETTDYFFTGDEPQVTMDDSGNAIITWYEWDGSNYQIFMSEYN